MGNYKLIIQYDGTRYSGWQRLKTTGNTIQGKIEDVLSRMCGEPILIIGASRTDAGVHAHGQVANVHLPSGMSEAQIRDYLNQYLPEDIAVIQVNRVADSFHARYHSSVKTYEYSVVMDHRKYVFDHRYQYKLRKTLDIERMQEAARRLLGQHDFQGFCSTKMKKSSVRTIHDIAFDVDEHKSILQVTFVGDGFLYHMIRILMGTLIEIGLGQRALESIDEILFSKDRSKAGYLVPPEGLCLKGIDYLRTIITF